MCSNQNNLIKQSLGLDKRARSSNILSAMNIRSVRDIIRYNTCSLFYRIFSNHSPARDLCFEFISMYLATGYRCPGTLIDRLLNYNVPILHTAFFKPHFHSTLPHDGIVDSLRSLLCSEYFIKPYSDCHVLAVLLSKSF